MYAVVAAGGIQHRVEVGDTIEFDRVDAGVDDQVTLSPVMIVGDDGTVSATPDALGSATVRGTVVEHTKGPKITVFTYRNKTGYRRKKGHRQAQSRVRIDAIDT